MQLVRLRELISLEPEQTHQLASIDVSSLLADSCFGDRPVTGRHRFDP
jgi:hypothetical protein